MRHPTFTYAGFDYRADGSDLLVDFDFRLENGPTFHPRVQLVHVRKDLKDIPKDFLNNWIFHLGLMEIPSYWKASCSPVIHVKAGFLDSGQKNWWKNLFINGLGEFFYQNRIDFTAQEFLTILLDKHEQNQWTSQELFLEDSLLTLVGGGKDSVVSIEFLKHLQVKQRLLVMNPTPAAREVIKKSGIRERIVVYRSIDPELISLNKQGYLNGHTPFSAYLAFLSLGVAALFRCTYIVASNERSAEEANITYLGQQINHQYSKSLIFESSFRQYVDRYISPSIRYFSLLRPLWEIQVSSIFSRLEGYHSAFLSCNVGQRSSQWCRNCPKCLSTYVLLYPHMGEKTKTIFGEDLFRRKDLFPLLKQLVGVERHKPFECVGTTEELRLSMYLSQQRFATSGKALPELLQMAVKELASSPLGWEMTAKKLLNEWGEDRFLPRFLSHPFKKWVHEKGN